MALVLPTPQSPAAILEKESHELKALKTSFPLKKTGYAFEFTQL